MTYRRRPSPLHAARAGAAVAYCLALALAALALPSPAGLVAVIASVSLAGVAAGVGRELRRAALLAVPLAIVIAVINALVTRDGLTVIVRLGDLPVLGHTDLTLEALAAGGILGLRAAALVLCAALYSSAVDPDEVLRLMRRVSFHSALSAALATRLIPILARDARRLTDAQRCRPGRPPSRVQLMRAATSGMLDRALDCAAALEVRGYGAARRPSATLHRPWSRHDLAFAGAAIAVSVLAVGARIADLLPFAAYPALHAGFSPSGAIAAVALPVCALVPFLDRRGVRA